MCFPAGCALCRSWRLWPTRLVLDHNLLRKLPDVVLNLRYLAVLQAAGNSITHLPDGLDRLQPLQALMVSENQVQPNTV